jgi:hypothetical protein
MSYHLDLIMGDDTMDNLVTLCSKCHEKCHRRTGSALCRVAESIGHRYCDQKQLALKQIPLLSSS